jgi:hypothetical protein
MARFYPSEVERECPANGIRRGCFARCFVASAHFFSNLCGRSAVDLERDGGGQYRQNC